MYDSAVAVAIQPRRLRFFFGMYVIVSRQVSPALRHGGEHGQTNAEDVLRFGTQGLTSWRRSTE